MKKILFISLLFSQRLFAQVDTTKDDTVIVYHLDLTKTQYQDLQTIFYEAAKYEGEQQEERTLNQMQKFLKSNLKEVPKKGSK